jgi:hypothetical protein
LALLAISITGLTEIVVLSASGEPDDNDMTERELFDRLHTHLNRLADEIEVAIGRLQQSCRSSSGARVALTIESGADMQSS